MIHHPRRRRCASYGQKLTSPTRKAPIRRPMRALLLPVKDLRNAKKRLTGVLTPEERFGLAQAMLSDMLRTVQGIRRAEKIFVVTNYQPVLDIADENGWEVLREDRQISESHAVDFASRVCEERGVTGLLRVPLEHDPSGTTPGRSLRVTGLGGKFRHEAKKASAGVGNHS